MNRIRGDSSTTESHGIESESMELWNEVGSGVDIAHIHTEMEETILEDSSIVHIL